MEFMRRPTKLTDGHRRLLRLLAHATVDEFFNQREQMQDDDAGEAPQEDGDAA